MTPAPGCTLCILCFRGLFSLYPPHLNALCSHVPSYEILYFFLKMLTDLIFTLKFHPHAIENRTDHASFLALKHAVDCKLWQIWNIISVNLPGLLLRSFFLYTTLIPNSLLFSKCAHALSAYLRALSTQQTCQVTPASLPGQSFPQFLGMLLPVLLFVLPFPS